MQKNHIEKLISTDTDAAEKEVRQFLAVASNDIDMADAYYLLGRIAWKKGDRAEAISCYNKSVELNPSGDAAVVLEQARSIMDFFNKDLYNP